MDWSIQEVAKLAGTTSRALRHYDAIGLLKPNRVASNGYRYYDGEALTRLQRILLLRDLGLALPAIAEALDAQPDDSSALERHLQWLRLERERIGRQVASVEVTIAKLKSGEQLMATEMLDGFDNTVFKEEVEQRWGREAYAQSDAWWTSKSATEKRDWQAASQQLANEWRDAAEAGVDPAGDAAQALARRQYEWLGSIPGTPGGGADEPGPPREYFVGLAEMYVADLRFASNYGGVAGAKFVRDAMLVFAEKNL